jgi:TonB family protein
MQGKRPIRFFYSARLPVVAQYLFLSVFLIGAGSTARLGAQQTSSRKVLVRVNPEYPDALRFAQIGGLVRLSVTVTAGGTVTQVQIRGGNPILAEKAQQAVMKWKFAPAPSQTVEELRLSFSPH